MKFGEKIETVEVTGIKLDIFSNGPNSSFISSEVSSDLNGYFLGIKYQCVELVRRFLYLKTGINFANLWQDGNARDWYLNAEKMGLQKVKIKDLKAGDIICFDGNLPHGHIGIISEIMGNNLVFIHQNCCDGDPITRKKRNLKEGIKTERVEYSLQGFLRYSK